MCSHNKKIIRSRVVIKGVNTTLFETRIGSLENRVFENLPLFVEVLLSKRQSGCSRKKLR